MSGSEPAVGDTYGRNGGRWTVVNITANENEGLDVLLAAKAPTAADWQQLRERAANARAEALKASSESVESRLNRQTEADPHAKQRPRR